LFKETAKAHHETRLKVTDINRTTISRIKNTSKPKIIIPNQRAIRIVADQEILSKNLFIYPVGLLLKIEEPRLSEGRTEKGR
jgi:hypothetical protein